MKPLIPMRPLFSISNHFSAWGKHPFNPVTRRPVISYKEHPGLFGVRQTRFDPLLSHASNILRADVFSFFYDVGDDFYQC